MGRSHAWMPRGAELIEPRPMHWGANLTMVGALRIDGWLTLSTGIVVRDNLAAHKARAVRDLRKAAQRARHVVRSEHCRN